MVEVTEFPGQVLLVGSVPLHDNREVLETGGRVVGDLVGSLPDGETGDRSVWVIFQAYRIFDEHSQLETLQRPRPVDGQEQWIPKGLDDLWLFKVRDDADEVHFDNLGYADAAVESYQVFRELRDSGDIPSGVRFQVSLPMTVSGFMWFFHEPGDYERIHPAYEAALLREVERITQLIPHEDLALQWDVCWEVLDIEGIFPWSPPGDVWERYLQAVRRLSPHVPRDVALGYHLCYADLGHQHMKEPEDLRLCVRMANAAYRASGRSVEWFHMPVPRDRADDAYFEPLTDLDVAEAKLFLGLIHHSDGVEGTQRRLGTAQRHARNFGVATECGFGRRDPATIPGLLQAHREVAALLD